MTNAAIHYHLSSNPSSLKESKHSTIRTVCDHFVETALKVGELLYNFEPRGKKVVLDLEAALHADGELRRGWWGSARKASDRDPVLATVRYLDIGDVGNDIRVQVEGTLNLVYELCGDSI